MPSLQHAPTPLHGGSSLSQTPATGFRSATLFFLHTQHVIILNNSVPVFSAMVVYIPLEYVCRTAEFVILGSNTRLPRHKILVAC